nr:hypothetical protein [Candidatus Sigynarchaeota archaeon]
MITIRKLILETIHMYHMPVAGNTNAGYYIVSNRDELRAFVRSITHRIQEMTDRQIRVQAYYYARNPEELAKETPDEPQNDGEGTADPFDEF